MAAKYICIFIPEAKHLFYKMIHQLSKQRHTYLGSIMLWKPKRYEHTSQDYTIPGALLKNPTTKSTAYFIKKTEVKREKENNLTYLT